MQYSIIVPAYNAASSLEACLQSLLALHPVPGPYEILLIDDGSTDKTSHVAKRFSRVRYFYQSNQGPAKARNLGVEKATGQIILFTDADCAATPNWLFEMARPFADPEIVGVKGGYQTRQKEWTAQCVQEEYEVKYQRMRKQKNIDFIDTYSAAFRRQVFLSMGGYDASFPNASVEDQEFSFRLASRGYKMTFNPQAVVYHLHAKTPAAYFRKKFKIGYWKTVVLKRYPDKMLSDSHTTQTLKLQMLLVFLGLVAAGGFWFLGFSVLRQTAFVALAFFILTAALEMRRLFARHPGKGCFAIAVLFLRSLALGTGLVWGLIRPPRPRQTEQCTPLTCL